MNGKALPHVPIGETEVLALMIRPPVLSPKGLEILFPTVMLLLFYNSYIMLINQNKP